MGRFNVKREAASKDVVLKWPRRRLIGVAVVIALAWTAFVLLGRGGDGDGAADRQVMRESTTTTGFAAAFDLPAYCEAQGRFTSATGSLAGEEEPGRLITALEVMSTSLRSMAGATAHPDLVAHVEVLSPVVDEALQAVRAASPEDVQRLAQDPRFADQALIDASTAIMAYPLRCP